MVRRIGPARHRFLGVRLIAAGTALLVFAWPALAPLSIGGGPRAVQTMSLTATPYLPFDLPTGPSVKKVFAHYMPNFPISIDNKPPDIDYYATQYLTRTGERGAHWAYGGYLRDRPLPRDPIEDAAWKDRDLRTEIAQAKSVGIDGFAVDIIVARSPTPTNWSDVPTRLLAAAENADGFAILPTADMSGPFRLFTASRLAAELAPYLSSPATFKLADGRPVLGAFYAESRSVSFWQQLLTVLRNDHGVDAAFVPTFLDAPRHLDAFAPVSYGFSNWGGRNPVAVATVPSGPGFPVDLARRSRALGKVWMQPVAFQDNRPDAGRFEESGNGQTLRQAWQVAIQENAEWAQLITWNDYSENTHIAPSVKSGWRALDMNAYSIALFKYAAPPAIVRDALFVSYRTQPFAARPTQLQLRLMRPVPGTPAARDQVEFVSFATAPATLRAVVGTVTYTCEVPAGIGVCNVPLQAGDIVAEMTRDDRLVARAQSTLAVTTRPSVQDLQYAVAGGLR
ncbi:glycoside hydrolase family 71 protein [Mycobacterium sp. pV006]|uniref:glycoside hydrolase family 71 protein n=1 Tax=Mycobacterium sp. pV006 TaxID=3238983 RepID=UPI00351B8BAA